MATPASNGDQPAVTRSFACIATPPSLVGDTEWFVPTGGRGGRRPIRVGEHLEPGHPLALNYPGCFTASAEPIDCWPVGLATPESRRRAEVQRMALASAPCRKVQPVCARCGAEAEAVILFDTPSQLDLISELSGLDDTDPESYGRRFEIESRFAALAAAAADQRATLQRIEGEFRRSHLTCPPGTPPLPAVKVPAVVQLHYRRDTVRTLK